MLSIGPAQISHRRRAVTPEDFVWLATEASREVVKAHCVPNRDPQGRRALGWVSVFIVPRSTAAEPTPTFELRQAVQRYLAQHADANLVAREHIFVSGPQYVPVEVQVLVYPKSMDAASAAEANVSTALQTFLHPLLGGPDGTGWPFGRGVAASEIYGLLEDIAEVDHVEQLAFIVDGEIQQGFVTLAPDALLASGDHQIAIRIDAGT
jgi:hypothetical protein